MVRIDASKAIEKLLATGDTNDGENAVLALQLRATKSHLEQMHHALTHPRYPVRRDAMRHLLPSLQDSERSSLLFLAKDKSADVRLTWAELMSDLQWFEAIPSLIDLLRDTRNFNSDPGFTSGSSWAIHSVARAAAKALGSYSDLPTIASEALLNTVGEENADPFVICASLSALADKDDPRISHALAESLEAPGLEDSPSHRPVAQAAAWALFDRAVAQKKVSYGPQIEEAILGQSALIAGPKLMALALSSPSELVRIEEKLKPKNFHFRKELLDVAGAVFYGTVTKGAAYPTAELARLAADPAANEKPDKSLERWSLSLSGQRDVQHFTAWLVHKACKLPITDDPANLRKYDLPERIGYMSMRSLTEYREVNDRTVDTGA